MNLIKNSTIYLFINIVSALVSFYLVIFYTHNMSAKSYGIYSFLSLFDVIFYMILVGTLFNFISRKFYLVKNQEMFFNNIYIYLILCFIFFSFFVILFSKLILSYFNLYINYYWLYIILILSFFNSLIQIKLIIFRFNNFINKFVVTNALVILNKLVFAYLFIKFLNLEWKGIIYSYLVTYIIVVIMLFKHEKFIFKFKKKFVLLLFKYNLSNIASIINWRIITLSDRFFISKIFSMSTLGTYTLAYQLVSPINLLIQSIDQAFTPYFMKNFHIKNYNQIIKIILFMIILIIIFLISAYFLIPIIVKIYFNSNYFEAVYYAKYFLLLVFFAFMHRIMSKFILINKKEIFISLITTFGAILNLILNYIFILKDGVVGVIKATIIVYIFIVIFELIFIIFQRRKYVSIF